MGDDIDGSSSAAHGAQDPDTAERKGLFNRLFDAFNPADEETEAGEDDHPPARKFTQGNALSSVLPGLGNLRRMRVEDVAIPKVEIEAVPVDIWWACSETAA